jgi:hypothetical protein
MPKSFGLGENGIKIAIADTITIAPQLKITILTLERAERGR